MAILVFLEARDGRVSKFAAESVSIARTLAGDGDVLGVALGTGIADALPALGKNGLTRALHADSAVYNAYSGEGYAKAVVEQAGKIDGLEAVIVPGTAMGQDLAPRIAAGLEAAYAADCTAFERDGDKLLAKRPLYAGKVTGIVRAADGPLVATNRPNTFPFHESGNDDAAIESITPSDPGTLRDLVKDIVRVASGKIDVAEADIIVAGGRGLGTPEQFEALLVPVADVLGAAIGASRAIVDAGWRPHAEQVGQTGKLVSPQLYIACGISGAIQHLAGMTGSRCIVAINKDADAPIFKVADYGIVGTVEECLPVLAEELKKLLTS